MITEVGGEITECTNFESMLACLAENFGITNER